MAWSAPMTAVANNVFTAAQFNTYVRDNLNETAPAKASAAGQIFVSVAANSIAARTPSSSTVATFESTSSNSFTDLATPGPSVTVTTGTKAIAVISAAIQNSGNSKAFVGREISGATSSSAAANTALEVYGPQLTASLVLWESLTAGSNTWTLKYEVDGNTGTFGYRRILVFPL